MVEPITVVIPTYNAGKAFENNCIMLDKQSGNIAKVLVIDSSSSDDTVSLCLKHGYEVEVISQKDFGHGKTRQYALQKCDTEVVVFLTQDALLENENSIKNLVDYLMQADNICAVYGRQLPYEETGVLGTYARLKNYGTESFVNVLEDRKKKGIKAAFLSDSFSAYKKSKLLEIGGFPVDVNFGEDMYVAAKFLLAGYKTGYCAEARVYHSHDYNLRQEFTRCKEIGRFHKEQSWLLENFGKAEGEGVKYVIEEAMYLLKRGLIHMIPVAFAHNVVKYMGYKS